MASVAAEKKLSIPAHKHCRVCGRSMPLGRESCSNECKEKAAKGEKRSKRMSRIWMFVLVIMMVFFVFMSILFRPPAT